MNQLKISKSFALPLDVAGEAIAILATRGAGKSFTSAVLIEEFYAAQVQTVTIDPTGVYWGLRSDAKGTGEGLPIIVLGGAHGDVPLAETAGKLIADLVVDTGQSLVLDLSDFESDGAQCRFMTDFAERLYRRKARSRTTLHLIVDEADEFAPQQPQAKEARMVGAMAKLVRRGRSRGIGLTLITQRSASLNKNMLDLVETLLLMRMLGPRDREAANGWIKHKNLADELGVLGSLPSLPTGTAWVWSPLRNVLEKVAMRRIDTFDSYVTPKPGEVRIEPKALAKVDLDKLGAQIKATAEKAKAEDPAALRGRISELERELKNGHAPAVDNAALEAAEARGKHIALEAVGRLASALAESIGNAVEACTTAQRCMESYATFIKTQAESIKRIPLSAEYSKNIPQTAKHKVQFADMRKLASSNTETLPASRQKILDALLLLEGMGIDTPSRTQLALWSEVSPTSGGYFNNLGALRTAGLIDYPSPNLVAMTDAGREQAQVTEGISSLEMQESIVRKVGNSRGVILRALIGIHPNEIPRDDLAAMIGVSPTSGGYFNNLGALRTLGLIDYPRPGYVVALPVLFL